jgi:hypothetical protein
MAKQPNNESRTAGRHTSKKYLVPINKMRVPPALVTQRPFIQGHGDWLAANLDLDSLGLVVINHREGNFWILDGQHRVYALRQNGFENDALECEVYEGLNDKEMAHIFLARDKRRAINPMAKFHVSVTAEDARATAILRAVETQGLKVSRNEEDGCIGAVGALGKVYDRCGDVVLGQTLRTIKVAWGSDSASFQQSVIVGLGLVFNRYNGKTNERNLADALSQETHGVRGLLRRAEAQREKTGNDKAQCVAASIVDVYNKRAKRTHKLPSWWKQGDAA